MELEHTFHTRHDFTPELGWAAFQLLAEIGGDGTTVEGLEEAARTLASPMARRSDLRKLLGSMDELGLLGRSADKLSLSAAGRALAASAGRYEPGFFAGIHCLYAWGWQWGGRAEVATPSWSYRQVRSEERRVGKGVDLGGRRIIKKKKKKKKGKHLENLQRCQSTKQHSKVKINE